MAFMAVEVCIWHLWLLSSMYVIDGCGGLYMTFMSCLWRSVYGIYGCRVQYMSLIAVEVCIWHLWLWKSVYVKGLYM